MIGLPLTVVAGGVTGSSDLFAMLADLVFVFPLWLRRLLMAKDPPLMITAPGREFGLVEKGLCGGQVCAHAGGNE